MTSPSHVPNPPVATATEPVPTPEVVKTATRIVRTKSFLSKQLKTTVPAYVAGVATALALKSRSDRNSGSESEFDNVDSSNE
jgi:hypothetical protein